MAKESKSTIMVATISAVSAVVIALITTYGTIAVSAPEAQRVKNDLNEMSPKVDELSKTLGYLQSELEFPVGTIIASMLQPSRFAEEVGDPSVFDPKESKWVLAAGKDGEDIATSKYGKKLVKMYTPDLRGMFLRGMNLRGGADPDKNRTVGTPQDDAFAKHNHLRRISYYGSGFKEEGDSHHYTAILPKKDGKVWKEWTGIGKERWLEQQEIAKAGDADETRPKNVAVYFYIKIN